MVGTGDPFYVKFGVNQPCLIKIADFEPIIARSASAVTPSEKTPSEKSSVIANRKSTTRFPMSPRWSSYVAPKSPKGSLKNAKRPISVNKIALRLKKVCYKVSSCENCQRQSFKAFIGLTNRAKIIGGGRPFVPEILDQWPRWCEIADFRSIFARSASAVTPVRKLSGTKF